MLRASALALLAAALVAAQGCGRHSQQAEAQTQAPRPHGLHKVTLKFDYDFRKTPACSEKIRQHCVQQFVSYDIYDFSAGVEKRTKLFVIPLPPKPKGSVTGITATSPQLDFTSGRHLLAVVAQEPDGTESMIRACTTWVVIP